MALILIAEESATERQRLRQILEARDHVIVEADNASYCLELIEVHRIDGVVLNALMSGIEDFELFQNLQKRNIPAIAISKTPQETATQHSLTRGTSAVLKEFPSADELHQTITSVLGGDDLEPSFPPEPQHSQTSATNQLVPLSINTLKNLIGIGIDRAAEILSEMTDCPIHFEIPKFEKITLDSLLPKLESTLGTKPICAAQLPFTGGFSGLAQLFFPRRSSELLTEAIAGEEPGSPDFEEAKQEMLTEVGNIVLNSVIGTIGNAMTEGIEFHVPIYIEDSIDNLLFATLEQDPQNKSFGLAGKSIVLLAQAAFEIQQLQIVGDIILFFRLDEKH
ncbi:MAG: response regulator [Prochloraceae cyanobacterium]|nr:response regulator [Prochloraceae cyanobacterium]